LREPTVVKTSVFITRPDAPAAFLISILRDEIERSVAKAAQLGFDGVDFLIGDPDTFDSRKLEKALADNTVESACINPVRMTTVVLAIPFMFVYTNGKLISL
jgi:hypothetical protein